VFLFGSVILNVAIFFTNIILNQSLYSRQMSKFVGWFNKKFLGRSATKGLSQSHVKMSPYLESALIFLLIFESCIDVLKPLKISQTPNENSNKATGIADSAGTGSSRPTRPNITVK
jgi:hypothetical protein